MKAKTFAGVAAVLLGGLRAHAQLVTTVWNPAANPTPSDLWTAAANWTGGTVPGANNKVVFNVSGATPARLASAVTVGHLVVGDGGPGQLIIAAGGSLTTVSGNWTGVGFSGVGGSLTVQPGGFAFINDHLWIGFSAGAEGSFTMEGGTVNVSGMFGLGWDGGTGFASINGGTLNLSQFHPTDSVKGSSRLNLTRGKIVINGNQTNVINAYVTAGKITAYGGAGTVERVFDSGANKTTLTAVRPPNIGPFPSTNWPATVDPTKHVHYYVSDATLSAANDNWVNALGLLNDGDQTLTDVPIKGFLARRASAFINVFDNAFQEWNTEPTIDILMQVYGDLGVLNPNNVNQARRIRFLIGTVPTELQVAGGDFSPTANNLRWNWILFTITNNVLADGINRKVGSVPAGSVGNVTYGGVNGGTIRLQGPDGNVANLAVHAVAFGQSGAFGSVTNINQFDDPDISCPPVPNQNLVGIDFQSGITNHLRALEDAEQPVTFVTAVGPTNDLRKAVVPAGSYLNFGILDNFLGGECQENANVKVCLDFYDDPAFEGLGVQFGPESFALDTTGTTSLVSVGRLHTLTGSGKWIRRSWTLPGVNLHGVNTAPLTGGPRFISVNGQVAVSRMDLAVIRTGTHPLAGRDPLAACPNDPQICEGVYGDFAELNLATDLHDGIDVGNSGGDQFMIVEESGPASDRRNSVRPSFGDAAGDTAISKNLNFAITGTKLGPTTQDNADVAIAVTYYDDPTLVGTGFRPQVFRTETAGQERFDFLQPVHNIVLQGTDKWRTAYWEIKALKFSGVNQGPQAAARFSLDGRVHVARIRYAVIRHCGPNAEQNLLSSERPSMVVTNSGGAFELNWAYRAPQNVLQSAPTLGTSAWQTVPGTNTISGELYKKPITPDQSQQFYRLVIP